MLFRNGIENLDGRRYYLRMAWFRKQQKDEDGYVDSGVREEQLGQDVMLPVKVLDVELILTRTEGGIAAFIRDCPHAAADLMNGSVRRGRVSCPEHDWKFDIQTGRTLWPEDEACRLKRFPVKVQAGLIWVLVG